MSAKTIAKLVMLALITVLAIAIFMSRVFIREKKGQRDAQQTLRLVVKFRLGCFLVMLVLVLICLFL